MNTFAYRDYSLSYGSNLLPHIIKGLREGAQASETDGKKKSITQTHNHKDQTQYLHQAIHDFKRYIKSKALCGRASFKYGFICEGFKHYTLLYLASSMITQFVKCFEVMRSPVKLSVSFKINST